MLNNLNPERVNLSHRTKSCVLKDSFQALKGRNPFNPRYTFHRIPYDIFLENSEIRFQRFSFYDVEPGF